MRGLAAVLVSLTMLRAGDTSAAQLSSGEQRVLDGAYLYLEAPRHCGDDLDGGRLVDFVREALETIGIDEISAASWYGDQRERLDLLARTAFEGRRGPALCEAIRARITVSD